MTRYESLRDTARPYGYLTFVKIAVSLSLVGLLIARSDIHRYASLLGSASPLYLGLALAVTVLSILVSAYKWRFLVLAQGFSVPLKRLVSTYFVGLFFNNFMPTSIGGDVVRIYDLRKMIDDGPAATASVVAERVLASFTLGLIVVCGFVWGSGPVSRYSALICVFVLVCVAGFVLLFQAGRLGSVLARSENAILKKAKGTFDSMRSCVEPTPSLVKVLVYSLVFQLMVVAINALIIKALGLSVPGGFVLLAVPVIFAVTMLPVSLNGLGLRETMYAYFFSQVGLSVEESVAISLFFFLIVTAVSLIGGVIFALRKR
ncbi:MAG: lysylphosphatidylglycerol synthase transmembrane domain-containing protein [Candidatus Aquicultorales bacterium]